MWHYAKGKEPIGPISADEMQRLIQIGDVKGLTLVWRKGLVGWTEAQETELREQIDQLPPPIPAVQDPGEPSLASPEVPPNSVLNEGLSRLGVNHQLARPWARFWARTLDVWLFLLIAAVLGGTVAYLYFPQALVWTTNQNDYVAGMTLIPFVIILTALSMAVTGTTVGKFLFGIRVHNLTPRRALLFHLNRELGMWVAGLAIGIPIIALFTQITQYKRVNAGRPASYDEARAFVEQARISPLRPVLGGVLLIGLFSVFVMLSVWDGNDVRTANQHKEWVNPVTGKSASISASWVRSEMENPGEGELFYFALESGFGEALIGMETASEYSTAADYGTALGNALSDNIEVSGAWEPVTIGRWAAAKVSATLRSDANVHIDIAVTLDGERAWRTLVFSRGQLASDAPFTEPFIQAAFETF